MMGPRASSDGQALFNSLHFLSETTPAVAKAIFSHVRPNTHALRGTNQLLRAAVNRSVSTVSFALPSPAQDAEAAAAASVILGHTVASDLGVTFPNATKLKLDVALHPEGAAFLAHLGEACPRLLAGLQAMDVKLREDFLLQPSVTALATFLAR
jgi:hypothetical protein